MWFWALHYKKEVEKLERIQRQATTMKKRLECKPREAERTRCVWWGLGEQRKTRQEWWKDFCHPRQMKFATILLTYLGPGDGGNQTEPQSSGSAVPELPCSLLHMHRFPRQPVMSPCEVYAPCFCHPFQFAALVLCYLAWPWGWDTKAVN